MIPRLEPAGLLLARVLMSYLFLHEALAKAMHYEGAVRYTEAFGLPGVSLIPAIVLEAAGGLLILTGQCVRPAAFVLSGFCVITALIFHTKAGDRNQLLHFEKNLTMAGGFLVLCLRGGGPWTGRRLLDLMRGRGASTATQEGPL